MQPIIEVQNISKKFKIFHKDAPYLSLRDNIVSFIKNPFKTLQNKTEEFWALKDVSFNVMPGESVGIIGKNGAGKSTLLKIISRITPPTSGKIILRGRVASLLEVGTGFHPELTGRENIFFNGAILGMRRNEIKKKFDEIVDFAGVEKFIDTPLKHYSSGMQLRLAFAVAAFLEAEILVVDEVLAVGDAEFQKKCLGKMEDVTKNEGRTVLFVSHNMEMIKRLCTNSIYLFNGNVKCYNKTQNVISQYLTATNRTTQYIVNKKYDNRTYFKQISLFNSLFENTISFEYKDEIKIVMVIENFLRLTNFKVGIGVNNQFNYRLFSTYYTVSKNIKQTIEITATIPSEILTSGSYFMSFAILSYQNYFLDLLENILTFDIVNNKPEFDFLNNKNFGDIYVPVRWEINQI